ncbi:hypothetical protein MNSC_04990 [Minisyncoccus archaeophilus]|uniref:DUF2341 domain-containing protein n=1 Tax=Minisyncoccus archaeiphilus TaxID=3238481 RepID=UPI00399C6A59
MNQKSFTLVELLIVIAIIGILAAFIIVSMSGASSSANDSRRKADINQLSKAVMIYKTNHPDALLPTSSGCNIGTDCPNEVMEALGSASVLRDPDSTRYYSYSSDGQDYVISSLLSNEDNYFFDSSTGTYSTSSSNPPIPGNGVCGIANNTNSYDIPTTGLCTIGEPSIVLGTGPWTWDCVGTTTVNCSANKMIDGICGTADDKEYAFSDSSFSSDTLCSTGNSPSVEFPNPGEVVSWTCDGVNGGTDTSCNASRVGLLGYSKRKSVTITSSSLLTDYQVKMVVSYDSDMQADFDDLRFTSSDGKTLLSYWIESKTNSSTATVWVKMPSLVSGNNIAYLYYGNAAAVTASNGDGTFAFFDDFEAANINTEKWNIANNAFQSGGIVTVGSDSVTQADRIYSKTAFDVGGYSARMRFRTNSMSLNTHWGFAQFPSLEDWAFFRTSTPSIEYYNLGVRKDGTENKSSLGSAYDTGYNIWEVSPENPSKVSFYINDVLVGAMTDLCPDSPMSVEITGYNTGSYGYCDWLFVRKYSSSNPSIVIGEEEGI